MGTTVDGDIIRVTAKMTYNAGVDDVQNVYHMKFDGPDMVDEDVHTMIAGYLNTAYDYIKGLSTTDVEFETIETWNLTQDRPMIENTWPTLTAGTGTGQSSPQQGAPLCLFNTASPRSQGRKFLPPPTETVWEGDSISSTALAAIVNWANVILGGASYGSNSLLPGNWSKKYTRFAPWISGIVETVLRTQRRRVRGVGS